MRQTVGTVQHKNSTKSQTDISGRSLGYMFSDLSCYHILKYFAQEREAKIGL